MAAGQNDNPVGLQLFPLDWRAIDIANNELFGGSTPSGFVSAWARNTNTVVGEEMKKNTASQVIGAQMVSATDGSAFTGSVTCYVTGDGGTQAIGSVGSGACTHEGNGFHTYAPAQAETNYDHIAFTFVGTGAVASTVQVYTTFPQTGDSYARIGSNGAGLSAIPWNASWDAEVQSECADALTAYDPPTAAELTAATANLDVAVSTRLATAGYTAPDNATISAIYTDTSTDIPATLATIANYIDAEVAAILAAVDTKVGAIKTKTDSLTFTVAGVVDANIQRINDVTITGDGQPGNEFGV